MKKLDNARYRASERKSEFFLNTTKWLGHEIDETGIKPNKEKVKATPELKHPKNQKQLKPENNREIKTIAFGSRYLTDSEKSYSIGDLELLAVVWALETFRFYLYGKKVFLYTDHQALEPLIKRNRCNRQYSARLTRWLDGLAHFDIAIQHITGNILKLTNFLSRNPVENATTEDIHDEQYVINILSEQAELNRKYGPIFADHLQNATEGTKTTEINFNDQSKRNRSFEKKRDVNKKREQAKLEINNRRQKAKTESSIQNSD